MVVELLFMLSSFRVPNDSGTVDTCKELTIMKMNVTSDIKEGKNTCAENIIATLVPFQSKNRSFVLS